MERIFEAAMKPASEPEVVRNQDGSIGIVGKYGKVLVVPDLNMREVVGKRYKRWPTTRRRVRHTQVMKGGGMRRPRLFISNNTRPAQGLHPGATTSGEYTACFRAHPVFISKIVEELTD